jgi:hypothetical protein
MSSTTWRASTLEATSSRSAAVERLARGTRLGWLCLLLASSSGVGCAVAYVSRAEGAYADGRYLEVAEDLSSHEADLPSLPIDKRARYGTYLGLALLKLGDHEGAQRWLDYAQGLEAVTPTLTPAQRQQLDAGRQALKRAIGVMASD